jgi:hypothetical protein
MQDTGLNARAARQLTPLVGQILAITAGTAPQRIMAPSMRNQCESDARSLGTTGYLDLLTCVQMTEDIKSDSKKEAGR